MGAIRAARASAGVGVCFVFVVAASRVLAAEPSNPAPAPQSDSSVTAAVLREIAAFKPGVSVARWHQRHPGDTVEPATPPQEVRDWGSRFDRGHWCMRASNDNPLGADPRREVYFYPPSMPADAALPGGALKGLAMKQCSAHLLSLEVQAVGVAGTTIEPALDAALTKKYGTPRRERLNAYLLDDDASEWKAGALTVVAGYDLRPPHNRVMVLVMDAYGRSDVAKSWSAIPQGVEPYDRRIIKQALTMVPVDDVLKRAVLQSAVNWGSGGATREQEFARDLRILREWLAATAHLDKMPRAAALLVADRLMDLWQLSPRDPDEQPGPKVKPKGVVRLEKLGAKMGYDELGGGYFYFYNWADEAWRLDPDGPAGRLAFVVLMDRGFDLSSGMCSAGEEEFRKVIAEGDKFLRTSTDPAINAQVHFMMGDAYGDIVALGTSGASGNHEYPEPSQYKDEMAVARVRAIEHYRSGLSLEHTSKEAREAWDSAWRLLAGLPPEETHYYCIYD